MNMKIVVYKTSSGKIPFELWMQKLDASEIAIIMARINRLREGYLGDCKKIRGAKGILELRIDYGPGYRIYCAKKDNTVILLLIGGIKGTQKRDIGKAIEYLNNYEEI